MSSKKVLYFQNKFFPLHSRNNLTKQSKINQAFKQQSYSNSLRKKKKQSYSNSLSIFKIQKLKKKTEIFTASFVQSLYLNSLLLPLSL